MSNWNLKPGTVSGFSPTMVTKTFTFVFSHAQLCFVDHVSFSVQLIRHSTFTVAHGDVGFVQTEFEDLEVTE